MFITDTIIDSIQQQKKQFVNTVFGSNPAIADALNSFVDAQASYTKSAVKAGSDSSSRISAEMTKLVKEGAKFDYAKAAETFSKSFAAKK